jgi:hypothetical protein
MPTLFPRRCRPAARAAALTFVAGLCAANTSLAATHTYSGALDDPTNQALVGSDLGAAQFGSDWDVAGNLAIYTFVVTATEQVVFDSADASLGGVVPYFSIFAGTGSGATFVDSNYDTAGDDFHLVESLALGTYTLVLGVNQNLSFAENYGAGTLGDGFTGIGDPSQLGNAHYEFSVTTPVPEPAAGWLAGLGLAATLLTASRKSRR